MSKETIQDLLNKLQAEIQDAELDADTRVLMQSLDADIQALLAEPIATENRDSLPETAQQLEAHFSASHPTAERFLREMIDTLARMGI